MGYGLGFGSRLLINIRVCLAGLRLFHGGDLNLAMVFDGN